MATLLQRQIARRTARILLSWARAARKAGLDHQFWTYFTHADALRRLV